MFENVSDMLTASLKLGLLYILTDILLQFNNKNVHALKSDLLHPPVSHIQSLY